MTELLDKDDPPIHDDAKCEGAKRLENASFVFSRLVFCAISSFAFFHNNVFILILQVQRSFTRGYLLERKRKW
jgi:hypothetical protein